MGVLLSALAACMVYRLITDPIFGGRTFITKKRKLLLGMLLLGATYAISGLGSGQWEEYGWRKHSFGKMILNFSPEFRWSKLITNPYFSTLTSKGWHQFKSLLGGKVYIMGK